MSARPRGRLTAIEIATALVALAVVVAIAIPLWRSHQLDERRAEAQQALEALQKSQDAYFSAHARYADRAGLQAEPPHGLGLEAQTRSGHFRLDLETQADGLGYVATARGASIPGEREDLRCRAMRIDHQGRRSASDADGRDTSADCWKRP